MGTNFGISRGYGSGPAHLKANLAIRPRGYEGC